MSKNVATFSAEEKNTIITVVNDNLLFSVALVWIVVVGLLWYAFVFKKPFDIVLGIVAIVAGIFATRNELKLWIKQ